MHNFSTIEKKTNLIKHFPIFINADDTDEENTPEYQIVTQGFDKFNYIFDGAAIGQYLGGVDPANISGNTIGFVNETCIIKFNKYSFVWKDKKPFIIIRGKEYPIFNLHIHSKNLKMFI
jgi:hypothetical protein